MYRNSILCLLVMWTMSFSFPYLKATEEKCSYMQTMESIDTVIELPNKTKPEMMMILKSAISGMFVSSDAVIDNYDESLGIIQIKCYINVKDYWGVPFMGCQDNTVDRRISIHIMIYVKDNKCKLEITKFVPMSKLATEYYMRKSIDDYLVLRHGVLSSFADKVIETSEKHSESSDSWDF